MILTTTYSVEGKIVSEYLGVVTGCDDYLIESVEKMAEEATKLGADAVVGIQISAWGLGGGNYVGEVCRDVIGTP